MNSTVTAVNDIPALDHEAAMAVAEAEYTCLLETVESLEPRDWACPTDCAGWDVKAVLGHLLGMMELLADGAEFGRQLSIAGPRAAATGSLRIDALTALQVEEHAHLTTTELVAALREAAPAALAGRSTTTAEERAVVYTPGPPFEGDWTRGYLFDIIHTRDPWLHRVDIARATGRDVILTPGHDGRIVADVVAEWAGRHGQPFTLVLDGPAGGTFLAGGGGDRYELDAVEFCRILSGRSGGSGLLSQEVPF